MEMLSFGTIAGSGSFKCEQCDYVISLASADALPECPNCGGKNYTRASLFTSEFNPEQLKNSPPSTEPADWLEKARDAVVQPGQYVVYMEGDDLTTLLIEQELTRIGRSLSADVRFDDPTVSRRHALIVIHEDELRVLDDRSLNGVFVNGERVEWKTLTDGDEIIIGRHQLRFIDATGQASSGEKESPAAQSSTS